MSIATASRASVGYRRESTPGTPETGVEFTDIRRKSAAGLNLTKDTYDSEEVRTDRMLADSRHGVRRAVGDIETELSDTSYGPLWSALMGQDNWTDTTSITSGAIALTFAAAPTNKISRASGSFLTDGFRVGDRVVVDSGLNAGYATIAYMSSNGLELFVDRTLVAESTTTEITVHSSRLTVGKQPVTFTIERAYADISRYQLFSGMRVNSVAVSLPPTGLATATWNFMGRDASSLGSSTSSSTFPYAESATTSVLAAANGSLLITIGGVVTQLAVATEFNFTIDNQLGGAEVVGKNTLPEIVWGNTQMVTGKVTVLFENEQIYNLFEQEGEALLLVRMDGAGANPSDYLTFTFPRCKFNTGSVGDSVATGLPVEMEFRSLLPAVNSNGVLQSQVIICGSAGAAWVPPEVGGYLLGSSGLLSSSGELSSG